MAPSETQIREAVNRQDWWWDDIPESAQRDLHHILPAADAYAEILGSFGSLGALKRAIYMLIKLMSEMGPDTRERMEPVLHLVNLVAEAMETDE